MIDQHMRIFRLSLVAVLALVSVLSHAADSAEDLGPQLVEAAKNGDEVSVAKLLAAGAHPDAVDSQRNTALIFAARGGHLGIARRLLEHGAIVNWQDGELVTPLILASFKRHPALVRLLLDHGADTSIRDKWGRRALDYALRRGDDDPIAAILRQGPAKP